jgi:hypothetical protein
MYFHTLVNHFSSQFLTLHSVCVCMYYYQVASAEFAPFLAGLAPKDKTAWFAGLLRKYSSTDILQ